MSNIIELDEKKDAKECLTIRPHSGTFLEDGMVVHGFIAFDTKQGVSMCIGLPRVTKEPAEMIKLCFLYGDKTFDALLQENIDHERDIICCGERILFEEYAMILGLLKPTETEVFELAFKKEINDTVLPEGEKKNGD